MQEVLSIYRWDHVISIKPCGAETAILKIRCSKTAGSDEKLTDITMRYNETVFVYAKLWTSNIFLGVDTLSVALIIVGRRTRYDLLQQAFHVFPSWEWKTVFFFFFIKPKGCSSCSKLFCTLQRHVGLKMFKVQNLETSESFQDVLWILVC